MIRNLAVNKCISRSVQSPLLRQRVLPSLLQSRGYAAQYRDGKTNSDPDLAKNERTFVPKWFQLFLVSSIAGGIGFLVSDIDRLKSDPINYMFRDEKLLVQTSTLPLSELDSPSYNTDEDSIAELVTKLKELLKNNADHYSDYPNDLAAHSDTEFNTHHATKNQRPRLIVFPHDTEEVAQIVKLCNSYNVPIVPFSGGTSLEGHFLPTRTPTISIDLSKYMNSIVKFHELDQDITVQAGLPWEDLNDFLNDKGYKFGCDPGPGAQLGGCVANSCSGTNAYRYGTMKENVVSLTVVLPDGTVVKTKKRPRKSSAGYNLNGLFVGSEGTLGIVTEVTVKAHVLPKVETVVVASFPDIKEAAACSSEVIQNGIQLNAMELLDDNMMKLVNQNGMTPRSDWVESPTLFFKVGGNTEVIADELLDLLKTIAKKHGAKKFEYAKSEEDKLELWEARKVALWSVLDAGQKGHPDAKVWTTDVAVPLSNFAQVIDATKKDMAKTDLINAIVGHAGDGNFHAFIIYRNSEEYKQCAQLVEQMVKRALCAEGTCTGEHGVGIGKRDFLEEELGEKPIDLMRRIKLAIDPKRIMNPDKIFRIDPLEDKHIEHEEH